MTSEKRQWRLRDVADLAAEHHGVVTSGELVGVGVPPSTCRRWCQDGRLVRLAPRAYLVPDLLDDQSQLAAVCRSNPEAVASHRAAALLWRLDGIEADVVEVSVPYGVRPCLGQVHRTNDLADFEVVEVQGVACADPTRTLIDLGAVVDDDGLERALESALRRQLSSVARMKWRLEALGRPGRPGPAAMRRVLASRPRGAPPTESDLETLFLQCLRAGGVRPPVRQHRVRLADGTSVRLDDAYPDELLFAELDGWATHGTKGAFRRDRRRQNQLVLLGWRPLRFTWADVVGHPERVATDVGTALAESHR